MKNYFRPDIDRGAELRAAIRWIATVSDAPSTLGFVASASVCNEGDTDAETRDWNAFIQDGERGYVAHETATSQTKVSGQVVGDAQPIEGRHVEPFGREEGLLWGRFTGLPEALMEHPVKARFTDGRGELHETE